MLARFRHLFSRVAQAAKERGWRAVVVACLRWGLQYVLGRRAVRRGVPPTTFSWRGSELRYAHHGYHYTWLNERAVEVALAEEVLTAHRGARVLEVGNVMSHYLPVTHDVVDKYEHAPGVVNADVVDLGDARDYDLILSVSTLEHVGLDEDLQDPGKPARAIEALKRLLAPGGLLWVTVPVGYNAALDRQLRDGTLGFDRLDALRRDRRRNLWREVPLGDVWDASYDRLLYTAHGLVVAEFRRPGTSLSQGGGTPVTRW